MFRPEHEWQEKKKYYNYFENYLFENLEMFKTEKEDVYKLSLEVLQEDDEDARWMAIGILGEIGDRNIISTLVETLSTDRSPRIRAEAAIVLGDYKDMEIPFKSLLGALRDPSEHVREKAFEALDGVIAVELEKGKYKSTDGNYQLFVEKPRNQPFTKFTFYSKKDKQMQRLKQKEFILLGSENYSDGKTDIKGSAYFDDNKLIEIGYKSDAKRISFLLK